MFITILIEALVACLLAVLCGYLIDRSYKALTIVGGTTLLMNTLFLGTFLFRDRLPLYQLAPTLGYFPRENSYIVHIGIALELAVALSWLGSAGGYLLDKKHGPRLLTEGLCGAYLTFLLFHWVSFNFVTGLAASWVTLIYLLVWTFIGVEVLSQLYLKGKGKAALRVLWLQFCLIAWIGYTLAGHMGLFFLLLVSQGLLWSMLYFLSGYLLPLTHDAQRLQAFRTLLTFGLGTNYAYYVIGDWQKKENADQPLPEPRVSGNAYGRYLAGPGIVLNGCDHAAVTWNGFDLHVRGPGLSFTGPFEKLHSAIDLRPQLRNYPITAETSDGIAIDTTAFVPVRIMPGREEGRTRQPEIGTSYPYDNDNILRTIYHLGVINHAWHREENGEAVEALNRTSWCKVPGFYAAPILKEILVSLRSEELHMPGDPRSVIVSEFSELLTEALADQNLELVGGGIGNLMPRDEVIAQRIAIWEAGRKFENEIVQSQTESYTTELIESVLVKTRQGFIEELTKIINDAEPDVQDELLAIQLIQAMQGESQVVRELERVSESLRKAYVTRRIHYPGT